MALHTKPNRSFASFNKILNRSSRFEAFVSLAQSNISTFCSLNGLFCFLRISSRSSILLKKIEENNLLEFKKLSRD